MNSEKIIESPRPRRALKILRIIGVAIAGVALAALFALLFGWLVMLLWNWLMPAVFGLKTITYWQAFGLTVLAKIFFGGLHHGNHHRAGHIHRKVDRRWHRWVGVDDEAPHGEGFGIASRDDMKHFRAFWKEQGEKAFEEYVRKSNADAGEAKTI